MRQKQISDYIHRILFSLSVLTVFLIPVVFNPYTTNVFDLNKTVVLAVLTSVLLVLWCIGNIATKSFRINLNPFTLPLFLFTCIALVASYGGVNPTISAFISTTAFSLYLFLFFLVVTTSVHFEKSSDYFLKTIVAGGVFLAVTAVLETMGLGPSAWMTQLIPGLGNQNIFLSPAGSAVILITYLIPTLIIGLVLAIISKHTLEKTLLFVASAVITSALVIAVFNVLPGKDNAPRFLPFGVSWQIAVENIKNPKSFLIGVGPANYASAFTALKPFSFNQTLDWNIRFNSASNWPLHIFTTIGVLGLVAWIAILFNLTKLVGKIKRLPETTKVSLFGVATLVLVHLFVPVSFVTTALFVFLLTAVALDLKIHKDGHSFELVFKLFAIKRVASTEVTHDTQTDHRHTQVLPWLFGLPILALSALVLYGTYRVYAGDLSYRQSLIAASQNDGTKTYDLQRQAISFNPYISVYRRTYAQTNLSIASALSQRGNLSDQDKQTISTLVRQAIREGRNAVIIEPNNSINWETLAGIYRQLINVADGASEWAISSYTNAVRLDPNNPKLRVDLGGIYYQLKNYPSAIKLFEQGTALKTDYANAYYNLGLALVQNNQLPQAVVAYEKVVELLDPSSADYTKALQELDALRKKAGVKSDSKTTTQPQTTQLQTPPPLASPNPSQKLDLTTQEAPPTATEIEQANGRGFGDTIKPSPSPEASGSANPQ